MKPFTWGFADAHLFHSHVLLLSPCSENHLRVAKQFASIDVGGESTNGDINFIARAGGTSQEVRRTELGTLEGH